MSALRYIQRGALLLFLAISVFVILGNVGFNPAGYSRDTLFISLLIVIATFIWM